MTPQFMKKGIGRGEVAYWSALVAVFFVFPEHLSLATSALTFAIFALSYDLILGFAGIVSLGHAVFYGIGAYSAASIALAGLHEPISGALLAGLVTMASGVLIVPVFLLFDGLALMMMTLAIGVVFFELANKLTWLTGGDNGLQGIQLDPLFGAFRWSVYSYTSYLYVLGWLFILFVGCRILVRSPFGAALQGIRENADRMYLSGAPVRRHLFRAYVISAFVAGIAGALSAQTTKFVGLEVISVDHSFDVVVMVVLGGVGRLYGGLIGAPLYVFVRDWASAWNPYYWMFVISALLILVVKFRGNGLLGAFDRVRRALCAKQPGALQ
jgi:branched-chain amino acid transport system permease protein